MKFSNKENHSHIVDGKIIWNTRSVAVCCVVIVNFKNKLYALIGRRGPSTPDGTGLWNLPSGYLDWNESGTEATIREVWEETGVNLFKENVVVNNLIDPWLIKSEPDENHQNVTLRYGCIINTDSLPDLNTENSEPDEVSYLRWLPINEIDKYDFAFEHDKVIKDYICYTRVNEKIEIISKF